jgi:hypothetical protein
VHKKSRQELLNTINVDEGELWSRWEGAPYIERTE